MSELWVPNFVILENHTLYKNLSGRKKNLAYAKEKQSAPI